MPRLEEAEEREEDKGRGGKRERATHSSSWGASFVVSKCPQIVAPWIFLQPVADFLFYGLSFKWSVKCSKQQQQQQQQELQQQQQLQKRN